MLEGQEGGSGQQNEIMVKGSGTGYWRYVVGGSELRIHGWTDNGPERDQGKKPCGRGGTRWVWIRGGQR